MSVMEKGFASEHPRPFMDWLRSALVLAFVAACCAPMIAISMSPKLDLDLLKTLLDPNMRSVGLETLRRSTPLWELGVSGYNTALYQIGTSGNSSVGVVGRDGWIFLGDANDKSFSQTIRRRVLSDQETAYWTSTLDAQARWLAARGIPMLFVVAPSQGSVYPEELPRWTRPLLSAPTSLDRVLASPLHLPLVDVRPELREAKSVAATYSRMNSHWTDFGAWVAWQKIAADLQQKLPGFVPFGVDDLAKTESLPDYANEYRKMLGIDVGNPWERYVLTHPFPDYQIVQDDGSAKTVPGYTQTGLLDLPRQTFNPSATSKFTALILRDSMGDALSPFLQSSFRKTIQLNHHRTQYQKDQINFIPSVEKYKPDVVIYVMTERYFNVPLGNTFYWSSVDRFGVLPAVNDLTWSPSAAPGGRLVLELASDGGRTGTVRWKDVPPAVEQVLRLQFTSPGYGYVRAAYKVDGKLGELYEEVYGGQNDLYFDLPGKVDANEVELSTGADAAMGLGSATLRRALAP